MQREIIKLAPFIKKLPKLLKVAAYARVSSGKEAMLHSLSAQISYYSKLIQENPKWKYAGVYADEAKTGTKDKRSEFRRLLSDCREGKIDLIITKSISRFARNTLDFLNVIRELKSIKVDVYFEKENIHSMSEEGELMLTLLSSFAQEESFSASENCKWRIRKRFQNGEPVNLRFLFGYKISKGGIEIDEENANIVRCIFSHYTSGIGCTKIARMLIQLCIPTLRGGKWTADSVRNIILNEKYKGDALLQKCYTVDFLTKKRKKNEGEVPQYYVKNSHEAIISPEVYDLVQAEIKKRAQSPRIFSSSSPFSSKIECAECGSFYGSKVWHSNSKYRRVVWRCNAKYKDKEKCKTLHVYEEKIKEEFVKAFNTLIENKYEVIKDC